MDSESATKGEQERITGMVRSSWHLTRWTARRARKRWMRSVRGRDAYVYRRGLLHWEVRCIDYEPLLQRLSGGRDDG